jgi:hypothetical protein
MGLAVRRHPGKFRVVCDTTPCDRALVDPCFLHTAGIRPLPTALSKILDAYLFVEGGNGQHEAFVCRQTGKIYLRSGDPDLDELEGAIPDEIEDDTKYAVMPGKRELDLGKPLVLDFVSEFLPGDFDDVREMFSRRGAYQKFRALLNRRRGALECWYEFESKATKRALREWCADQSIEIAG